jgi:F-type H+-transporting ATPase subunit delta
VKERRAVMDAVAEKLGASPLLRHFWSYLIDRRRLVQFDVIRAEYDRLADERAGVVRAQVRSASELSDAQRERLQRALSARVRRRVALDVAVEPELLGGLVAQVGDLMFDGSLRTQLRQLGASLARE